MGAYDCCYLIYYQLDACYLKLALKLLSLQCLILFMQRMKMSDSKEVAIGKSQDHPAKKQVVH